MTTVLSLVFSAGALLVAAMAVVYARRQATAAADQLMLARQIRQEASEPYVVVDIAPETGGSQLLLFRVENLGPTMARDVRVSVSPPLQGGDATWDEVLARVVARKIPHLPPRRRIEWAFSTGPRIFGDKTLPRSYTVTVNATGPAGPVEPLTYFIDLDAIDDSQLDHSSVETSLVKVAGNTSVLREVPQLLRSIAHAVKALERTSPQESPAVSSQTSRELHGQQLLNLAEASVTLPAGETSVPKEGDVMSTSQGRVGRQGKAGSRGTQGANETPDQLQ